MRTSILDKNKSSQPLCQAMVSEAECVHPDEDFVWMSPDRLGTPIEKRDIKILRNENFSVLDDNDNLLYVCPC